MSDDGQQRRVYVAPWRVDITVRPGAPRLVPHASLARAAARALAAAHAPSRATLAITLSDDAELAVLNRDAMGVDAPTDVLSFPLLPPSAFPAHPGQAAEVRRETADFPLPPGQRPHLGDIVVSVERAVAQAEEGRGGQTGDVRWTPHDELLLLVTHGTLHICGWDHAEPEEEAAMRALERQLLAQEGARV